MVFAINFIEKILSLKKEKLKAQICRIEYRISEISDIKNIIERDARTEFKTIIARLENKTGEREALVAFRLRQLQGIYIIIYL